MVLAADGELSVNRAGRVIAEALVEDFAQALEVESSGTAPVIPLKKRAGPLVWGVWHEARSRACCAGSARRFFTWSLGSSVIGGGGAGS